jgi:hypothetical protein
MGVGVVLGAGGGVDGGVDVGGSDDKVLSFGWATKRSEARSAPLAAAADLVAVKPTVTEPPTAMAEPQSIPVSVYPYCPLARVVMLTLIPQSALINTSLSKERLQSVNGTGPAFLIVSWAVSPPSQRVPSRRRWSEEAPVVAINVAMETLLGLLTQAALTGS